MPAVPGVFLDRRAPLRRAAARSGRCWRRAAADIARATRRPSTAETAGVWKLTTRPLPGADRSAVPATVLATSTSPDGTTPSRHVVGRARWSRPPPERRSSRPPGRRRTYRRDRPAPAARRISRRNQFLSHVGEVPQQPQQRHGRRRHRPAGQLPGVQAGALHLQRQPVPARSGSAAPPRGGAGRRALAPPANARVHPQPRLARSRWRWCTAGHVAPARGCRAGRSGAGSRGRRRPRGSGGSRRRTRRPRSGPPRPAAQRDRRGLATSRVIGSSPAAASSCQPTFDQPWPEEVDDSRGGHVRRRPRIASAELPRQADLDDRRGGTSRSRRRSQSRSGTVGRRSRRGARGSGARPSRASTRRVAVMTHAVLRTAPTPPVPQPAASPLRPAIQPPVRGRRRRR